MQNFLKWRTFLTPRYAHLSISEGKKCLFFEKFDMRCFIVTSVLRFALLPYYRRIVNISRGTKAPLTSLALPAFFFSF